MSLAMVVMLLVWVSVGCGSAAEGGLRGLLRGNEKDSGRAWRRCPALPLAVPPPRVRVRGAVAACVGGGLLGRQAQFCASAGASVSETSALAMMASRVFFHMME